VPYVGERIPSADGAEVALGANCQRFAYWVLARFDRVVPPLRSSELWEDTSATTRVPSAAGFQALDLVLFNATAEAYGAHVGVFLGGGQVLHLCREVGRPAVWTLEEFAARSRYATIVGAKRTDPRPSARTAAGRAP
jgi:hypothetical protein